MKCINKITFLVFVALFATGTYLPAMQPGGFPPPPPTPCKAGRPPRVPVAVTRTPSFGEEGSGRRSPVLTRREWRMRGRLLFGSVSSPSSPLAMPAVAPDSIAFIEVEGCFRRFFNRLGNGFEVLADAGRLDLGQEVPLRDLLPLARYIDQMIVPALTEGAGRFTLEDINKIFDVYVREPFANETLIIPHMGVGMAARPPASAASSSGCILAGGPSMGSGSSSMGRRLFTTPVKHVVARLTSEDIMYRFISHVLRSPAGSVDRNLRRFVECFFAVTVPTNEIHPKPIVPSIGNNQTALVDVVNKLLPRILSRAARLRPVDHVDVDLLRDELFCCFETDKFREELAAATPAVRGTPVFREGIVAERLETFIESSLPSMRALIIDRPLGCHYETILFGVVLYYLLRLGNETLVELEREANEKRIAPFIAAMRARRFAFDIVRRQFIAQLDKERMMSALEVVGLDTLVHFEPENRERLEAQVRHLLFTLHCYRSAMPEVYLAQQTDRYYRDAIRLYKLVNDSIVAALNELDDIESSLELLSMKNSINKSSLSEDAEAALQLQQRHEEIASSLAAAYHQIRQRANIMGPVLSEPVEVRPSMVGAPGAMQVYSYAYKNLLCLAKAIEIYLHLPVDPINFDNILFIKDYHAYQVTNEPGCSDPSGGHFEPAVRLATMPGRVYPAVDLFELSDEVLGVIMDQRLRVRDFVGVARHELNGVRSGEWKIADEAALGAEQSKQSTLFPNCYREHYFMYVQRLAMALNSPEAARMHEIYVYRTEGMPNARASTSLSRLSGVFGHEHINEKLLLRHQHFCGCGCGVACSLAPQTVPMWVMMYRHCDRFAIRGQIFTVTAIHSVFPMLVDDATGAPLGNGAVFTGLHGLGRCELVKREGSDRYEKRDM